MIISKDKQGNWTPTAGGTGTFIGTAAAFNAIKDTLPVNTVAYITDDGNGDLQPVDAVTNGDMHPVTSNAVYDAMNTVETGTDGILSWTKCGHLFKFNIAGQLNDGDIFTLPYAPVKDDATLIFWGASVVGYADIRGTSVKIHMSSAQNGFISVSAIVQ